MRKGFSMRAFHEIRTYDSDYMVWQSSYTNISFLAHWHQEIEFIYVRSGSIHLSVNEDEFTAHQGDLVLIDTGDFHYSDSSERENQLDFLIFAPGIVSSLYHHSYFIHPLITAEQLDAYGLSRELPLLIDSISRELNQHQPYYQEIVTASIRRFWYELCRNHPRTQSVMPGQNKRMNMLYDMQKLLSYMEDHYTENITLSFAAAQIGFSESHFSKVFKKLMGVNFVTYLSLVRVEQAAAMLKNTSNKITDIAMNCGFNNVRSFNRTFKEVTGYTPSQFIQLSDSASYNLTYYKRKSQEEAFVRDDSLTLVQLTP